MIREFKVTPEAPHLPVVRVYQSKGNTINFSISAIEQTEDGQTFYTVEDAWAEPSSFIPKDILQPIDNLRTHGQLVYFFNESEHVDLPEIGTHVTIDFCQFTKSLPLTSVLS